MTRILNAWSFLMEMFVFIRHGNRKVYFTNCLLIRFIFFAVGGAVLPACGENIDSAEWREEVKLSDDSVIVVQRKARAKSSGFPDARRGANIDHELRYDPEGIHWKGGFGGYGSLMSFDQVDGSFYLVRYAQSIQACTTKKPDDYAIQILKWQNGQWIEVSQAEAPVDRLRWNLEDSPWGHNPEDDTRGLLRLDGFDGRPYRISQSARDNRTNPETIQSYFERTAIDPRTKQRAQDLFRWNLRLCGYWHKVVPVATSLEEARQRLKETKKEAEPENQSIKDR